MTAPVAHCPSCGAEIRFRWAGAVQTVCGSCSSVLVRRGVELERVGRVSEPPPVTSRVQVGTRGVYRGTAFTVVGRIAYAYGRGSWSEWHLALANGRSGWLSDAQDEYAVTFLAEPPLDRPEAHALHPGATCTIGGRAYTVATVTRARYAGVEGELPFEYWDHSVVPFADLVADEGLLATLDYSENPPLLYQGEYVALDALELTELRDAPERRVQAETLNCPNCGGTVDVRRPGETVNAVCQYCQSVLDATLPKLKVLQSFADRVKVEPLIPLGATGRMHGAEWTVLGFQQRTIRVEGVAYSWREYLLHAPERGFRYLTEYNGHWNDVVLVKAAPRVTGAGQQARLQLRGHWFRHFQRAQAETTFVLGEFPWQVRVGDRAQTDDFVHPPLLVSREQTDAEVSWSVGEYTYGARVWEAFGLPGNPPLPRGVFANQPTPHPGSAPLWYAFMAFALALLLVLAWATASTRHVYEGRWTFLPDSVDANVMVGDPFTITGRPSRLRVRVETDVDNAWAFFQMSLVDERTGRTREFSREVSYYHGYTTDGRWSEGSRDGGASVGRVPPGRYRLIVAPQGSAPFSYSVRATHGAPTASLYLLALLALLVPPVWRMAMRYGFERSRWMESDYPPSSGEDD